ncbi:hypothetical protein Hanom_Chr14g01293481 [Helianthus anomalus]
MIRIPTATGPTRRGGPETGIWAPSWAGVACTWAFSPCSCIRTLMRSRGWVEHPATIDAIPPSTNPFKPIVMEGQIWKKR